MAQVTINRFHRKAHLPTADFLAPLDRATQRLTTTLPELLEAYGGAGDVRVCVRSLDVRVRIPARELDSEATVAALWASAIVSALSQAVAEHAAMPGDEDAPVVWYRNDAEALYDLVRSTAVGNMSRSWAWQQLGLFPVPPPSDVRETVLYALAARPRFVLPVLARLQRNGALPQLHLSWKHWRHIGRLIEPPSPSTGLGPDAAEDVAIKRASGAFQELVRRALALSPLTPAFQTIISREGLPPEEHRRALALLALTAGAPELQNVAGVATVAADVLFERNPALLAADYGSTGNAPGTSTGKHESSTARGPEEDERFSPTSPPDDDYAASDGASFRAVSEDGPQVEESAVEPVVDSDVFTPNGGLVFLLNLACVSNLGKRDGAPPTLHARPLRWILLALGCELTSASVGDAAVLALAGLGPEAAKEHAHVLDNQTRAEREAITALAMSVDAELQERLPHADVPLEELRSYVIRRQAWIRSDPGWIEIHLPLNSVDIGIRRAGLDLNPDYVSYLGCVVRFYYE